MKWDRQTMLFDIILILIILLFAILLSAFKGHAEETIKPTVIPLYILNDDNKEYYTIGILDRSKCPDPQYLIYSPNCQEWVEVIRIPKDIYNKKIVADK